MNNLRFDEKRVLMRALNTTDLWRIAGRVRLDFPRFPRTLKRLEKKGLVTTGKGTVRVVPRERPLRIIEDGGTLTEERPD
jgi:predicted methyltransferase